MKPLSTYRIQFNPSFRFADAQTLAPYFASLGVTHLYCSPILAARPGSAHGYDTCDHSKVNPEIGGEDGFREMARELRRHGLGVIVDFVPNHMAADPTHNPWWRDVLANGPSSPYAGCFDIDWDPVKAELKNKLLLPILGGPYGEVLESGELRISWDGVWFRLRYWQHDLPLNPKQVRSVLRHEIDRLESALGEESAEFREYLSILFQLDHLPLYTESSAERRADRLRETEVAQARLARLAEACGEVRGHLESNVDAFNGRPGDPSSFDLLHDLLERQVYRLAYWRTALHEINYRRFFDINELAALRMESEEVFAATHAKILELVGDGLIDGIRLDHLDGLYDPAGYCHRLRSEVGEEFYIVVEKILSGNEPLDEGLMVDGTTGYGVLNSLNRLFVRSRNAGAIQSIYRRFTGKRNSFRDEVDAAKQLIITSSLASELNLLAHELNRISESNRRHRDFTLDSLQEALREVVVSFDVYRTYISGRGAGEQDAVAIDRAVRLAVRRNPALDSTIFDFIRDNLRPQQRPDETPGEWERRLRFAMKFQQYTAPVQAKGVEDTAFYRYCPLISLNEVGGEPEDFGVHAVQQMHVTAAIRQTRWPSAMVATSTHDTKRGEDARARINVLSEVPEEWRAHLRVWARTNLKAKRSVNGRPAPDRNDEYLYYQALLGAWPPGQSMPDGELVSRMKRYLAKAVKEAKVHTSWVNPSNEYDAAVEDFVEQTLTGAGSAAFLKSLVAFAGRVAELGARKSLAQLALKATLPGVPDFYQGSELWDLSLVDPDNRRPVDYPLRARMLSEGEEIKLRWTTALLRFRRANPRLFLMGEYTPLIFTGPQADHLFGFLRHDGGQWTCTLVVRWPASWKAEAYTETTTALLPLGAPRQWVDLISGHEAALPASGAPPLLECERVLGLAPATVLAGAG